jgi:histidinol dehydrogenase
MKILLYPSEQEWDSLCKRPSIDRAQLDNVVRQIITDVRHRGDDAIADYTLKFDKVRTTEIKVSRNEIDDSENKVPEDLKEAIKTARNNIEKFHSAQMVNEPVVTTGPGIKCWRKCVAIEKVGLYIPGGSAPLFSTLLMLGIPARIAGCSDIIVCTPPDKSGEVNPTVLYVAKLLGINTVIKAGGAQAIAAMAYGTRSVPGVYKIFGPGNQYVTKAKEMIMQDGIPVDLPAGPSEVLVIADRSARPEFIAADLLSQAEHGPDSQVILVTDNRPLLTMVKKETERQLKKIARRDVALKALENSLLILFRSIAECTKFSNLYAPEHLIINTMDYKSISEKIINAGSVFLGKYSCESAGDYATGTNHTLPTNGFARNYSGVSTESFMKKITFQELSESGIRQLGPAIMQMAVAENLDAHKNAVSIRLNDLSYVRYK